MEFFFFFSRGPWVCEINVETKDPIYYRHYSLRLIVDLEWSPVRP